MSYSPAILIADDEHFVLESLKELLSDRDYEIHTANGGREAIDHLNKRGFDLVLLDISMPDIDGFKVMDHMKRQNLDTLVIIMTGNATMESAVEALRRGAYYYIIKPFQQEELSKTIANALDQRRLEEQKKRVEEALKKAHSELEKRIEERTEELLSTNLKLTREIEDRKITEEKLEHTMQDLRKAMKGTIKAMALAVETRDLYTAGHQQRVTDLACAIAEEMELSGEYVDSIRMAGMIHDLGKIAIPVAILSKPGKISEHELGIIKSHTQVGYDILKDIEFPWPIAQIVLQHHERMDGSGNPNGISGNDILMEAKILAVADVVEAMASHRPYRPGLGIDKALDEIKKNRGLLYDSEVVDACLKVFAENGFTFEEL